jgi:TolA-binding protein
MSSDRKVELMDVRSKVRHAVLRVFPRAGDVKRALTGKPGPAVLREQDRLRETDRRQARRLDQLEQQTSRLRSRIAELEAELQECRRLNKRVAELTDLVAEVLLPEGQRDDDAITERLRGYDRSL